ncbi:phage tail assembly protein [Dongia soli]|uniref:Phage tail assembly protein n=1 Tax=Dongia soli TaxID=600628 RepID=A0ABU5E7Z1_9PROT|nr:phage tail assembly protein [Dongia soli]MDY0882308.1 phage tail assembly protein [Dongia soli]
METIDLQYPIAAGSAQISRISLKRPTVGDMRAIEGQKSKMAAVSTLLGKVATLPDHPDLPVTPSLLDKLDFTDFAALTEKVESFLPKGRETGEND